MRIHRTVRLVLLVILESCITASGERSVPCSRH